jgi:integrase
MSGFSSAFAQKLEAMLDYREACGFKREKHLRNLLRFDAYCCEHAPDASALGHDIVHGWIDSETARGYGILEKATSIRQFGKYLNAVGEEAYILPEKFSHHAKRMAPYIFTDAELSALFAAIDKLPPDAAEPNAAEIAPVLFRLIYTCGLRPNEGREILCENVNLDTGEILIAHTKRNRERIVVMSDDMAAMCRSYDFRRGIFSMGNPYYFPSFDGGAISSAKLYKLLNTAWFSATCSPQNPAPQTIRVYDLRHRFASACLNRWLDGGEDIMAMLPYLRAFMGHGQISETAYYIHLLPEKLVKSAGIDWDRLNTLLPEVDICPD